VRILRLRVRWRPILKNWKQYAFNN
jgi:hypothetical protein